MTRFANEAGVREQERQAKEAVEDLRKMSSTPEGQRFLLRLLTQCRVFTLSMTGNSQTFFNEGQRSVGLGVIAELGQANPEALVQILRKANEVNSDV